MKKLLSKIKKWWDGKFIPYSSDSRYSFSIGYSSERPFITKLASKIMGLLKYDWRWSLAFLVTIVGLIITIITLLKK
jgi:hypothetical protein